MIIHTGRAGTMMSIAKAGNPKLRGALSQVEFFDQTTKAIDDLKKRASKIRPTGSVEETTADIFNLVAAGHDLPTDVLDRYLAAQTAEQVFATANSQLDQVHAQLVAMLDQITEAGLTQVCNILNTELQQVYGELRKLRAVPTDAVDAITRGKAEQWQRKTVLLDEYSQIRDAQRLIVAHGWKLEDDIDALRKAWPLVGHASGLGAFWPEMPEYHRYGRTKDAATGQMRRLTPPWPDPDSAAFVDWLLDHPEVNPWVPTLAQAEELLTQITSNVQTLYEDRRGPTVDAWEVAYSSRRLLWGTSHVAGRDDNVGLPPEERR